jgi:hypothetical protein
MRTHPAIRLLCSLKITVVCLALLFILTAWGTFHQVEYGLYAAQKKFFHSFIFRFLGFLPFPGGQLVLWVLFINLLVAGIFRYAYVWKRAGILLIHWGLVLLLVGAFATHHFATESFLALREGEGSNLSSDYHHWELALTPGDAPGASTAALDASFKDGDTLKFEGVSLIIRVERFFRNAVPLGRPAADGSPLNASGITQLEARRPSHDPAENVPGLILTAAVEGAPPQRILLHGGENAPLRLDANGETHRLRLQRKKYPLPFTVRLVDFKKEEHPGTQIARNFESTVEIRTPEAVRDVRIFMNNPLRHRSFTFYQSSYSIDQAGNETSVFAVVENAGRWFPYVSSGTAFAGLLLHFMTQLLSRMASRPAGAKEAA